MGIQAYQRRIFPGRHNFFYLCEHGNKAKVFGDNNFYGQLGLGFRGGEIDKKKPQEVKIPPGEIESIASSNFHTIFLLKSGAVYSSNFLPPTIPKRVNFPKNIEIIRAYVSNCFNYFITQNGKVYKSRLNIGEPVLLKELSKKYKITAVVTNGTNDNIFIDNEGKLHPENDINKTISTGGETIVYGASSKNHSIFITKDENLVITGSNLYGALRIPQSKNKREKIINFETIYLYGDDKIKMAFTGDNFSFLLSRSNKPFLCGSYGSNFIYKPSISTKTKIIEIAGAGPDKAYMLDENGFIYKLVLSPLGKPIPKKIAHIRIKSDFQQGLWDKHKNGVYNDPISGVDIKF